MGIERRDNLGIVSDGDCTRSPAVKTLAESDDTVPAGVEGSQFHGILIGFGSGIVKEQGIIFITGSLAQLTGKFLLQRIDHAVGIETDAAQLVGDGSHVVGM